MARARIFLVANPAKGYSLACQLCLNMPFKHQMERQLTREDLGLDTLEDEPLHGRFQLAIATVSLY